MAIAADWCVSFKLTAKIQYEFGDTSRVTSEPGTAKRTNAKFLIACVLQLITLLVMLTRAMINNSILASSAYTSSILGFDKRS